MKIFITGASGFIGSFLFKSLLRKGSYKIALLLREPEKAWRIQEDINHADLVIKGELETSETYKDSILDFQPDVVVHLAWKGVGNADRNSFYQWENVPEMYELMNVAHDSGAHTFIGLGSQAEYGPLNARISEGSITEPTTIYGASKLAACNYGRILAHSLGMRFGWLRLFSSYGPMDQPGWLLPYLINTFLRSESPNVTSAEQRWDYIYVQDVVDAIISLIESPKADGVFNLGSGEAHQLRSIIEMARDLVNPSLPINFGAIPYRADQVMHLEADISKLSLATGWSPKVSLEEGLGNAVAWWKSCATIGAPD